MVYYWAVIIIKYMFVCLFQCNPICVFVPVKFIYTLFLTKLAVIERTFCVMFHSKALFEHHARYIGMLHAM